LEKLVRHERVGRVASSKPTILGSSFSNNGKGAVVSADRALAFFRILSSLVPGMPTTDLVFHADTE
jgi:hypothetical protein